MATNLIIKNAQVLSVVCSHPTTPAANDPVRFGFATGVALNNESADISGETTVDFGQHVWDLSCKGVNDSGNSAIAVGDAIFYVDADTPRLSKKSSGYFFGYAMEGVNSGSTDTIRVLHIQSPGSGTLGAGTVGNSNLAVDSVDEDNLFGNLKLGFIPLDIGSLRIIAANVIGNTSEGMLLDGNTAPSFQRVNSATDKALRVIWAASSSVEVQFPPVPKPPDLDGATALTIHLLVAKDTNTDNAVTIDIQVFDGIGDTECGAATAALATASLTEYSASVSASDLGDAPGFLNIALVPGTHTTDAIHLHAAWIEYTRLA